MGNRLSINTLAELERCIFQDSLNMIMKGGYDTMVYHVGNTAATFGADDYERSLLNNDSHQLSPAASTHIRTHEDLIADVRERTLDGLLQGEAFGKVIRRSILTAALWGRQNMKRITEERIAKASVAAS